MAGGLARAGEMRHGTAEGISRDLWSRDAHVALDAGPPMNHDTGSEGVKGESSLMTLRSVMGETHAFLRTRTDLSRLG